MERATAMRDPFKPQSNKQLIREAQFGFSVIGLLVATLIYVAWFRLNGLDDVTPEHVRNSPVAMQVFPNSPNYDRESHTMRSPDIARENVYEAVTTKPLGSGNTASDSALVTIPKRVLEDSNRTARSLQVAAESINQSASRVATLSNPPKSKKTFELVSNPADKSESDSGFEVLNKPESDLLTKKEDSIAKKSLIEDKSSIANRFSAGGSFGAKSTVKTPVLSKPKKVEFSSDRTPKVELEQVEPVKAELPKVEPAVPSGFNEFKPLKTKSAIALPKIPLTKATPSLDLEAIEGEPVEAKPLPAEPFGTFTPPKKVTEPEASVPRLPKLPEQSLSSLRSPDGTKAAALKPDPSVKTVSFEKATWKVKKGDSYWSIAQANYGDPRFFRSLYEYNKLEVPGFEDLTEGVEINLPTADELIQKYAEFCPSDAVRKNDPWRETPEDLMKELTEECEADLNQRFYETKSGDTLFEIARRQLGQASRYVELIKLNEFRLEGNLTHETELPTGIQLLLPKE